MFFVVRKLESGIQNFEVIDGLNISCMKAWKVHMNNQKDIGLLVATAYMDESSLRA